MIDCIGWLGDLIGWVDLVGFDSTPRSRTCPCPLSLRVRRVLLFLLVHSVALLILLVDYYFDRLVDLLMGLVDVIGKFGYSGWLGSFGRFHTWDRQIR